MASNQSDIFGFAQCSVATTTEIIHNAQHKAHTYLNQDWSHFDGTIYYYDQYCLQIILYDPLLLQTFLYRRYSYHCTQREVNHALNHIKCQHVCVRVPPVLFCAVGILRGKMTVYRVLLKLRFWMALF